MRGEWEMKKKYQRAFRCKGRVFGRPEFFPKATSPIFQAAELAHNVWGSGGTGVVLAYNG